MQLQKITILTNLLNFLFFYIQGSHFCTNHFFLINHTLKFFGHSNLNEPERKNFDFVITQLSEVEK